MTKNPKTILMRKALKLWFLKYLKDCCEVCGGGGVLQGHHFYYRSSYGHLKYDENNHITLCQKCHFILHHQDPKKITDLIIDNRGKSWYNKLKKKAYTSPPPSYLTMQYYKDIIVKLQKDLDIKLKTL